MTGKPLLRLTAVIASVLGLPAASAVMTSKNVDIIVTHGAALTTSTYVNTSGSTVQAGAPLLMAQAFRRGDVFLNSNCAIPRNASTHNPLIWQHDNTATRRENGDDGSVRHWSFGVLTDAPVPPGGKYTIEWISTGAACPTQTQHQGLGALASAHDLKLHFTNVVNADLTIRGSGSMTFDINAAAANTGRDAPIKYATGPVYDGWRIVGSPTWDAASSGRLIGAMLSPTQMTLSNWTGITNGSFHVTVDGAGHDVTGVNLSAVKSMTDVATAINARLTAVSAGTTMSFDPNDQVQRFELFSNSTGTNSTVSFLTAAASGTDISAQLLMTSGAASYNSGVNAYTQAGVAAGSQDPLLYAVCYVDATTQSDGVIMGKVRTDCAVYNGWMNVAAGTTGNAGNPGPAGYANDPQMVVYRPSLLDGTKPLIDWGAMYDYTASATTTGLIYNSGDCLNLGSGWVDHSCFHVPTSGGDTPWIGGMTHVFTTTGTPPTYTVTIGNGWGSGGPGSFTPGHYYGDVAIGTYGRQGLDSTYVGFTDAIYHYNQTAAGAFLDPISPGTGQHTWSYRTVHPKWAYWMTLTPEGFAPWSDGASMSVSPFDIALDQGSFTGERRYWEETGTVVPMRLTGNPPSVTPDLSVGGNVYYAPMGRGILDPNSGGGQRGDLSILNAWAAACWYTMSASDCQNMRGLFLAYPGWGFSSVMNEATGRIPPLNNGPLNGNGIGTGGSYPVLGSPWPDIYAIIGNGGRLTYPTDHTPIAKGWGNSSAPMNQTYGYSAGLYSNGGLLAPDHEPEVLGLNYQLYGNPLYLDIIYAYANHGMIYQYKYYTDTHGQNYYAQTWTKDQSRGAAWMMRTRTEAAAYGDDSRPERLYFDDTMTEAGTAYNAVLSDYNGPGHPNAIQNSYIAPNFDWIQISEVFIDSFTTAVNYTQWTLLRDPGAKGMLDRWARYISASCGHSTADWPAFRPAYWCTNYVPTQASLNGTINWLNNDHGQWINTTDGLDIGDGTQVYTMTTGSGKISVSGPTPVLAGDTFRITNQTEGWTNLPDQLDPTVRYTAIGPIDTKAQTFYLQCPSTHPVNATCPTPGAAFTGFTVGGVPFSGNVSMLWHGQYDDGTTVSPNYVAWKWQSIVALDILGYNMTAPINQFNTRFGTITRSDDPATILDPTVVVP